MTKFRNPKQTDLPPLPITFQTGEHENMSLIFHRYLSETKYHRPIKRDCPGGK